MLDFFNKNEISLFHKQLAKRLRFKNIFKSILIGTVIFFTQYFLQLLLSGDGWYVETSEFIVEVILSTVFGIAHFFMWNHLIKSKFKKITNKLGSKDFEIANFGKNIEQEHNYNGILFLKKDSLNFTGNFYSKQKTIQIEMQHIDNVGLKRTFWMNRGFSIAEKNSRTWHFKTEDPDIWVEAIKEKISMKSSSVH